MMRLLSESFLGTVIKGLSCVHGLKGGQGKGRAWHLLELFLEEAIYVGPMENSTVGIVWGGSGGIRSSVA